MLYSAEEINEIFKNNKLIFDRAYLHTKIKYGIENAALAMQEYFYDGYTRRITKTANSRDNLDKMLYHGNEIDQFLIEYAMSSYIANDMNIIISKDEMARYANDMDNPELRYDRDTIVSLVAIAGGWSPYWLVNLISCNRRVKEVLVQSLIEERYVNGQKQKLDSCRRSKLVRLPNGKTIMISIDKLNRDIDNMIRDDEATYFKDDDEIIAKEHHVER